MFDSLSYINWEDLHFLRPYLLWLILPAFLNLIIGLIGLRENIKWKKVIAPHLRPYVIKKGSEHIRKRLQYLLFIILTITILGLAGPTWKRTELPGKTLETPLVILMDLSPSMLATDIQPSRYERSKFKINDLLQENPGARIALIAYAGTAHTVVPLSRDYNIISSHVNSLSPDIMPVPGDNLSAALSLADTVTGVTDAPGTILLISDDFPEESFRIIQEYVSRGKNKMVILPMNTPGGADVKDAQGKMISSSLNSEVMRKLSSFDRVEVQTMTLDKSDMELLAKEVSQNLKFKEKDEEKEDEWQDMGLWLVIPFAFMLLLLFRKGLVVYSLILLLGFSSCNSNSDLKDLWLTKDYQAQQYYDSGEYEKAADMYSDPLYKGVAYYQAGEYEKAIQEFEKDTTAMGSYNLGLAYFKEGDYAAAQFAFGLAAEMDPDMEEAGKNQALMQQMITASDGQAPEEPAEAEPEEAVENIDNAGGEDLGGGGQEATEEDMQKERKEETAATDMRTGKELEEVPPDFEAGEKDDSQKVLLRKVDDDPALFLKRKFKYQAKKKNTDR